MIDFFQWLFSEGSAKWVMVSGFVYVFIFFLLMLIAGKDRDQTIPTLQTLGIFSSMAAMAVSLSIFILNLIDYIKL